MLHNQKTIATQGVTGNIHEFDRYLLKLQNIWKTLKANFGIAEL